MTPHRGHLSRRNFVKASTLVSGAMILSPDVFAAKPSREHSSLSAADLPKGTAPQPVAIPHFSDRLQAFVWRNWTLVPVEKLASVVGAKREDIVQLGRAMGLPKPLPITRNQQRRSYITVLRRNWHLLPYEQLLTLLDWTLEPTKAAGSSRADASRGAPRGSRPGGSGSR
ncbi:MAG: twin-arginine translocation signal domain-containing protein [Verrucomicrobia bacterium]|nr:twin-arginine translocation signal domain-containing protein [Verrucomicrobiota bacterium]